MRTADIKGTAGNAWKLDIPALLAKDNRPAEQNCVVSVWVIEAPESHPFWWWYMLSLIHLRPIPPAFEKPMMYRDDATHEILLQALDPSHYPPSVDTVPEYILMPANFAAQIKCDSDDHAALIDSEVCGGANLQRPAVS
jgi:hypothetical protein